MIDIFDQAADLESEERDSAIARARRTVAGPGASACTDCGEPIPAARRSALPSATRCIDCQDTQERRSARRA